MVDVEIRHTKLLSHVMVRCRPISEVRPSAYH